MKRLSFLAAFLVAALVVSMTAWAQYLGGGSISGGGGGGLFSGGTLTSELLEIDGTATDPAYSFASDTNTGLYRIGADTLGVAAGGANAVTINSLGLGINATPGAPLRFWVGNTASGGGPVAFLQNTSSSGSAGTYVGESISAGSNYGALTWHGSAAAMYTGWPVSSFGLRTPGVGGIVLDSTGTGPIIARVNGSDRLNITSTLFEAGGAIISSGTVTSFRTAGAAANTGITLPTCNSTTQFHQFAVDDTNDTASAMLCWCRRGTDDSTYAWVSIHDNTTACIDP